MTAAPIALRQKAMARADRSGTEGCGDERPGGGHAEDAQGGKEEGSRFTA